ncbi:CapA family protein [Marinicellulosiphila megalodicopiae]|uniref:CapA family protein n=1 Tax=Marinicellulosiphila megalodicopiae TaxID=2724896 RepID=UPI003BAE8319
MILSSCTNKPTISKIIASFCIGIIINSVSCLAISNGLPDAAIIAPVDESNPLFKTKNTDSISKEVSKKAEPSYEVTLLFAGDAMQHAAQFNSAYNQTSKTYDYDQNFIEFEPIIKQADIAIINLETTLGGKPYAAFPQFSSPVSFAKQLQTSGFDIVMLANNHSNDRWQRGVNRTINQLDKMNFTHSGTYKTKADHDENVPLMIEKNGLNLAFLNYTFATNGIDSVFTQQVKRIKFDQMRKDIRKAKKLNADSIIVYIHWGDEYQTDISKYQQDVAAFLIESKVDVIIGSHPHVVQPMIWQKEQDNQKEFLLAYSLGNFISNQRDLQQSGGALLEVTLKKIHNKTNIKQAGYYLSFVKRELKENGFDYQVLPVRLFEKQVDALQWDQYGMLLKYLIWAKDFLDENNQNVPEFQFINNQWGIPKSSKPMAEQSL